MELLLFWLLGLLSIFSGVGSVGHDEGSPTPEPTAAASPVLDPIEEQFTARAPLPSCGEFQVEHGYYEQSAQPGWQCLEQSADGPGGEAQFVAVPTGTLDATYTWVRVADGIMEIYVHDQTNEIVPWTYETCSTADSSFRQGCP